MAIRRSIKTVFFLTIVSAIAFGVSFGAGHLRNFSTAAQISQKKAVSTALNVQVQVTQGFAAAGNTQPTYFLALVTDQSTGQPITDLAQSNFAIYGSFLPRGTTCASANNIVYFENRQNGAYLMEVAPAPPCSWFQGDYLDQVIIVGDPLRNGQTPVNLSIK